MLMKRALAPTLDGDPRAHADLGHDVELVRQPLRAAEAQAEAVPAGIAVLERLLDISDAGTAVGKGEADATPLALREGFDFHFAAAAVNDGVARQLARGGHQLGLIHQAES